MSSQTPRGAFFFFCFTGFMILFPIRNKSSCSAHKTSSTPPCTLTSLQVFNPRIRNILLFLNIMKDLANVANSVFNKVKGGEGWRLCSRGRTSPPPPEHFEIKISFDIKNRKLHKRLHVLLIGSLHNYDYKQNINFSSSRYECLSFPVEYCAC